MTRPSVKPLPSKPQFDEAQFARDMVIAVISTTGQIPYEQAMREIVRQSRVFKSELLVPTVRPKAKDNVAPQEPFEEDGAEMLADDNLTPDV